MNTDYFPKQLYNDLDTSLDYFCGAYKAASHNFTVSTQFDHITSSGSTSDVADNVFDDVKESPSFDLKAKHFISHVLVGAVLLVPILNFFVFKGFESHDATIVDVTPTVPNPVTFASEIEQQIPLTEPVKIPLDVTPEPIVDKTIPLDPTPEPIIDNTVNIPLDEVGDDSPEDPPLEDPKPTSFRKDFNRHSRVVLEDTHTMRQMKRRNSKVMQKAYAIEESKLMGQQQRLDAELPVLDGERSNPVTIAEFKEIESSFTKEFFRLFPNETRNSQFASLRKNQEAESLGVVLDDSKYIESFILYTDGTTPEARFVRPTENLAALNQFIIDQYPTLKDKFYILGNFKNDMQNKIDAIPYISIIKNLFNAPLEAFLKELNQYKFVSIEAMEGEKTPIRIDTAEFQQTHKKPGSIQKRLNRYRNSVSSLK